MPGEATVSRPGPPFPAAATTTRPRRQAISTAADIGSVRYDVGVGAPNGRSILAARAGRRSPRADRPLLPERGRDLPCSSGSRAASRSDRRWDSESERVGTWASEPQWGPPSDRGWPRVSAREWGPKPESASGQGSALVSAAVLALERSSGPVSEPPSERASALPSARASPWAEASEWVWASVAAG